MFDTFRTHHLAAVIYLLLDLSSMFSYFHVFYLPFLKQQQYAFIHDALREYLLCPEHEISAMAFPSYVQCLRMPDANGVTGLQKQFEVSFVWLYTTHLYISVV